MGAWENVWTVQVRHLLTPETPTGLQTDWAAKQGRLSNTAGTRAHYPKLFPLPNVLVRNYHSEHNAFSKESDLRVSE